MQTLRSVFGCFVTSLFLISNLLATSQLFHSNNLEELQLKLSNKEFHGVKGAHYESSVWSAVAALETRAYPWSSRWWRKTELTWPKRHPEAPYYQGKLPAYFYEGKGDKLLVIFGTSFGSFGGGTWYRKFLDLIRQLHPDTSVLIFPGYLSKQNLMEAKPLFADAGVRYVSYDYLVRINEFVQAKARQGKFYKKIGSVGLSGGASLVLRILQSNTKLAKQKGWNPRLFNWGNIALSPVLSASAAAEVVDAQADYLEENEKVKLSFDIEDWLMQKIIASVLKFSKKINAHYMLEISQDPDHPYFKEVQSLVAYSVIHELANFSKRQSPDYKGPLRLKEYYEDYSYPNLQNTTGHFLNTSYEAYSSFSDAARDTRAPLRLVFAEDDPILSINGIQNPESRAHPKVLSVLASYKRNPNVKVDLHRFGGHLAYVLDTEYLTRLFRETFK